MSAKVIRCDRCRRRCRNTSGWNVDMIAGLVVAYLCPTCQTPEEDLDAELNLITGRSNGRTMNPSDPDFITNTVNALANTYPTPEALRSKANQLAAARSDATEMVGLMRAVADRMEAGDMWEMTA